MARHEPPHSIREDEADRWIDFLNHLHRTDPAVLLRLIDVRVPCNEAVAKHPTIQVGRKEEYAMPPFTAVHLDRPEYVVGFLGILNGFLGVDERGWGPIAAVLENQTKLLGFQRTPPPTIDVSQGAPRRELPPGEYQCECLSKPDQCPVHDWPAPTTEES